MDGLDGVSVQKGVLTFSNAKKGKYTLTISDKNGKYADITTEFELYAEAMPAVYDADKKALVKAEVLQMKNLLITSRILQVSMSMVQITKQQVAVQQLLLMKMVH